jgi:signal transduction histidine kinase
MPFDVSRFRAWIPRGFAARLALATSALIAVVCLAQSTILARSGLEHVRRHLTARGNAVAAYLAREAATSMGPKGVGALQQLAEQAQAQGGVVYTRFFDARGLLLVAVGKPPAGATPLPARPSELGAEPVSVGPGLWEFQLAIRPNGDPSREALGTVAIGVSVEPLVALSRHAFRTAVIWTALLLLASLVAAVLLARAITRPLTALAAAADRIADGDFDAGVVAEGDDELARLGHSFNAMVDSLRVSRAAIEEQVHELEQADHLKSEFLATVSHELRTPLNVIIGYAEMLVDGVGGPLSPEQQEMIDSIKRYSCLQRELITNVLDFSRLTSGAVSMHVEPFTLGPLLEEIESLYRDQLRDRPVRLVIAIDEPAPAMETDRIKLQEVVRNLVDNAIKFTEQGQVTVSVAADEHPGWLSIGVSDTGPGIPPAELGSIFEAFRQIGDSSTRQTGGVGLGLSIVHRLVGVLGGSVTAESRFGEGSTFRVRVPTHLLMPTAPEHDPAAEALDSAARNADDVRLSAPGARPTAGGSRSRTDLEG